MFVCLSCHIFHLIFLKQGGRNISLARNEQNPLKPSGDYLLVPLLEDYDYSLLESDTEGIVYFDEEPECLEYFTFLCPIKRPEVLTYSRSQDFDLGSFSLKVLCLSKASLLCESEEEIPAVIGLSNCRTKNLSNADCGQKRKAINLRKEYKNKKARKNKIKNEVASTIIIMDNNLDLNDNNKEIILRRCRGCHVDHFPLPKFCRWWETRKVLHSQTGSLPYDINLVKNCIESLEGKLNGETSYHENEGISRFFHRSEDSCHPYEFPDMFNLKLRGGGSSHKVAIKSNNVLLDSLLSLFRDMGKLWHANEVRLHPLCNHKQD